ncbi:MAG: hybrid sensor histidine kinase/response regulator [Ghiorsea sp.]|nr:hybrid sensor histidine kinase/response regulator [Ghiorsea sp.]
MIQENDNIEQKVSCAMLRIYMDQIMFMRFGNLLSVSVIAAFLWTPEKSALVTGWLIVSLMVSLVLTVVVTLYRYNPYRYSPRKWAWLLSPGSLVIGIAWGSIPLLFIDISNVNNFMIFAIIAMGHLCASLYTLSLLKPLYYLQLFGVMSPLIYAFYGKDVFLPAIMGAGVLSMVLAWFSHHIYKMTKENLRARIEKDMQATELEQAREESERANRLKTSFLASASHDLRQPLQAMALYAETLKHRLKSSENIKTIDALISSHHVMSDIMDSLLDISKLDAGIIETNIETVNLKAMLHYLQHDFQTLAEKKGVQIRSRISNLYVKSDPHQLLRILTNLISNAIRYTDSGGMLLACRMRNEVVVVEVWDSGRGIPDEQLNNIFLEFYQINPGDKGQNRGLGLGLAIVRRLVLLLPDHHIDVTSKQGHGSRFRISLPLAQPSLVLPEPNGVDHGPFDGLEVLLIDDDSASRDAMATLMEAWGCTVSQSDDAPSAIALVEQGWSPDTIVADYRLGEGRTGVEAVAAVRQHVGVQLPALMVTGESRKEILQDIHGAGLLLLHKPIVPAKLKLFLKQCRRG